METPLFEVEQKFPYIPELKEKLTRGRSRISIKEFTDAYFDTPNFSLTRNDWWLRRRSDLWELKIPLVDRRSDRSGMDQYEEIADDIAIQKKLSLPQKGNLEEVSRTAGFTPFCSLTTRREKYHHPDGDITLDFDTVTAEDGFRYLVAEAELTTMNKKLIPAAKSVLTGFFKKNKIPETPVRGKVIQYIYERRRDHYTALVVAGVVKES